MSTGLTREDIADLVRQYGRECFNSVESFRCADPDQDAVLDPICAELNRLRGQLERTEAQLHEDGGFIERTVEAEAEGRRLWGVASVLRGERDEARAAVERVRELHVYRPAAGSIWAGCAECGANHFPCPTLRALDGAE